MSSIIDDLKWGGGTHGRTENKMPTHEALLAAGAEETGYTIESYDTYNADNDSLSEGADTRTYVLESPGGHTNVVIVPDRYGFHVEDFSGTQWRPEDLDQLKLLLEEIDHQMERYGELL